MHWFVPLTSFISLSLYESNAFLWDQKLKFIRVAAASFAGSRRGSLTSLIYSRYNPKASENIKTHKSHPYDELALLWPRE